MYARASQSLDFARFDKSGYNFYLVTYLVWAAKHE